VRRLQALFLIGVGGCSGFVSPTPEDLRHLGLAPIPAHRPTLRHRIRLSVDSKWLAGEFDGVVLAQEGAAPVARMQLFGDVGPKALDLLARPDRVVGFFPQAHEGIDCRLPAEAAPHPLLFLGVSLLEEFADVTEDRVVGIRPDRDPWWVNLKPVVPGMRSEALVASDGRILERRFRWMYGLEWRERWDERRACTITASGLLLRVRVLDTGPLEKVPERAFDLTLPEDVRLAEGSRK
jgi:hypothetical protein